MIKKDSKEKNSPFNTKLKGFHYQIECKTRMMILTMKGHLNNMARAAVVRQCELVKNSSK